MIDVRKQKFLKDGYDKGFLEFIDVIKWGYWNLQRIGMEGETLQPQV